MLSFDDGPLPMATDRVLDALSRLRTKDGEPVRAAFFLLGDAPTDFLQRRYYYAPYELWSDKGSIAKYPEIAQRVKAAGHTIGSHTTHHAWFHFPWLDTPERITEEIGQWEAIAKPVLGNLGDRLLRPPYLVLTEPLRKTADELGYRIVLGNTVGDANPGTSLERVKKKSESILREWHRPYPCVLIFHDVLPITYEHIEEIVRHLQRKGYRLVHFDPHRI